MLFNLLMDKNIFCVLCLYLPLISRIMRNKMLTIIYIKIPHFGHFINKKTKLCRGVGGVYGEEGGGEMPTIFIFMTLSTL